MSIQTTSLEARDSLEPRRIKSGQKFSRLTALSFRRVRNSNPAWECICDCGKKHTVVEWNLLHGFVKSCGCLNKETSAKNGRNSAKHNMTATKAWSVWKNMHERCNSRNHKSWMYYGGRGIKVCERWKEFIPFFQDMGHPHPGMTLDRINTDGDYSPENCRWATYKQQARNRRSTILITAFGESKSAPDWADDSRCSVILPVLGDRIRNGWNPETAITKPSRLA